MTEISPKKLKKTLLFNIILVCVLPYSLFSEEQTLDHQTTAVRYVFTTSVERELYPWLQEEVANTWFDSNIPKSCHICDNVYRYPVDNGSVVTRGVQNLTNRKRLASILEVNDFLTVIIRQSGEAISVEASLHNLKKEEPIWAKVFEWSKPWW
tara:strand:- start:257 stop:715 length:459 start_codon:yes stop_codon:yes gene_type:complete